MKKLHQFTGGGFYRNVAVLLCLIFMFCRTANAQTADELWVSTLNQEAIRLVAQGKDVDAEPLFKKSIAECEEKLGKTNPLYVILLNNLGDLYSKMFRSNDAAIIYQQIVTIREQKLESNNPEYLEYIASLSALASTYSVMGRYVESEVLFKKALFFSENKLIKGHPFYTICLNMLGSLYMNMGKYSDSEPLLLKAVALSKELEEVNSADYTSSINNLSSLYAKMSRYLDAEPLAKENVLIHKQNQANDFSGYVIALNNLGSFYEDMGRYQKAEEIYLESLSLYKVRHIEIDFRYAELVNNLGSVYQRMGRFTESEERYKEALNIKKQKLTDLHPAYATSLNNLAVLYEVMRRYKEAEPLLKQALAIRKLKLSETHPDYIVSLNNLAGLYRDMGRGAEAEPFFLEAMISSKKSLGEKHILYAICLNNLADFYARSGCLVEAEQIFIKALAIKSQLLGETHPEYLSTLNNLAGLDAALGCNMEAEQLFQKCLLAREEKLGTNHPDYAVSLVNLAGLYQNMGRYREAEPLYKKALTSTKQSFGNDNPSVAECMTNLATLYRGMGRNAEAEGLIAPAIAINFQHIRATFSGGLSERDKEQFFATLTGNISFYNSLAVSLNKISPQVTGTAYNNVLFSKGMLLQTTAGLQRLIRSSSDTALTHLLHRWQAEKHSYTYALSMSLAQRQSMGLNIKEMYQSANKLEEQLSSYSSGFYKAIDLPNPTWLQVQQGLKPNEAAIELVRFKWYTHRFTDTTFYAAYIITHNSINPELVLLRNGNELEQEYLTAYRSLIAHDPEAEVYATAKPELSSSDALYKALWYPIAQALPSSVRKVYIAPDGVYNQINLATLRNPVSGKYLLDEMDLRLLGSTRELIGKPVDTVLAINSNKRKEAKKKSTIALFGFPTYELDTTQYRHQKITGKALPEGDIRRSGPDGDYKEMDLKQFATPLYGTKDEVQAIDKLFDSHTWKRECYLAGAASEENVNALQHPTIVHLATHGFFLKNPEYAIPNNPEPLLHSGLILAGAVNYQVAEPKPARADGLLTAYEAALLDLQGTELVVLSACETGLGDVRSGEGVYGLQRGFFIAGTHAVLMSLWKVNDAASSELMVAFYKYWLLNHDKRAALSAAQHQLMKQDKYRDPFFWGGFVLIGQ